MTADVYPLQLLPVILAGWVNRHQRHVRAYVMEENRVLKAQLKGRRLRRWILRQVATIVTPDTILRWRRHLLAWKWTFTPKRPGRWATGWPAVSAGPPVALGNLPAGSLGRDHRAPLLQ